MKKKSPLAREEKRMHDSQNAVDRVWIGKLSNLSCAALRVPSKTKVCSLSKPSRLLSYDTKVVLIGDDARRNQVHHQIHRGVLVRAQKTLVAILNKISESVVVGQQSNRNTANLDDNGMDSRRR
jgi:hypothetical protein